MAWRSPWKTGRGGEGAAGTGAIASPPALDSTGIATPNPHRSASPDEEEKKHRKLHLVSREGTIDQTTDRHPQLQDIQSEDLADTKAVLELHEQAQVAGLADGDEKGELEFVAMVERARVHGRRSGTLLMWLLRKRRSEFITHPGR